MKDDEATLISQVAQGDRDAFTLLVHRHLGSIEAYACRVLGDPSRAQDVAQEVFLRFWQRADQFDAGRAQLSTWLHRIAHNLCIDQFREGARFQSLEPLEERSTSTPTAGDDAAIQQGLALLPERQRTALVLTYYQALPNRDVAQIMNLSVRALESLLVRARRTLRESVKECL